MNHTYRSLAVVILGFIALPQFLPADAIVVTRAMTASTIAEIFVQGDAVRVELEIGPADLPAFRNILPDALYQKLGHAPQPLSQRRKRFFADDWVVRADDGPPLSGEVKRLDLLPRVLRDEITGQPLPNIDAQEEIVVFVEIEYPLFGHSTTLSIKPPTSDEADNVAANIGFVAYHLGLPVNDFRYLSGEVMLDLDWEDPWYSRFRNPNLRRQFATPVSAFLYVDYFEVRQEIIVRPKDLQDWVDLGLDDKKVIAVEEQEELKQRVGEFLARRNPVQIDGKPRSPTLDRIHFIRRTLRQTGIIEPPENLDVMSATLGVIFVYPTDRLPQDVRMTWDLFTPRIPQVSTVATDQAGGFPYLVSPDDPVLHWQNFLKDPKIPAMIRIAPPPARPRIIVPLTTVLCAIVAMGSIVTGVRQRRAARRRWFVAGAIAILCGGLSFPFARGSLKIPYADPPQLAPEDAVAVLAGLLHNIYRAFDRREESLVYDRLSQSISGDLLSDVYLQTRRSMQLENQGGAQVKVDEVTLVKTALQATTDAHGFLCQCVWTVTGSVGHWGHTHRRTNQYEAVFTVDPIGGAWRITDMELREEVRVQSPESRVESPESRVQSPELRVESPGSRVQSPGSNVGSEVYGNRADRDLKYRNRTSESRDPIPSISTGHSQLLALDSRLWTLDSPHQHDRHPES